MTGNKKILFIAGEASGDLHGAALIEKLKQFDGELKFCGIGGDRMKDEGMHLIEHINNMAFMGFTEVVKHLPDIRRVKKNLLGFVEKENVGTAVLIDYPGFNLNIAERLKEMNLKIIYYITPQVWAWGKGRVKKIRRLVDKVLVILPFEKEFFSKHNIESVYVGHPLIDRISRHRFREREKFCSDNNLDPGKNIICILPGSREQEVYSIFPETIKAAARIASESGTQTVVACSDNIRPEIFEELGKSFDFKIVKGQTYDLLKNSRAGIVKSGTSTLEAALLELPMVVVYKTNPVTYQIGKRLVKLDYIGLVNIIAGEEIAPELIQNNMNAGRIYTEIKKLLSDAGYYNSVRQKLREVKLKLGGAGASDKAAREIMGVLQNA